MSKIATTLISNKTFCFYAAMMVIGWTLLATDVFFGCNAWNQQSSSHLDALEMSLVSLAAAVSLSVSCVWLAIRKAKTSNGLGQDDGRTALAPSSWYSDKGSVYFVVCRENQQLPAAFSHFFKTRQDNQESILISLIERRDGCSTRHFYCIHGIPSGPAGSMQIQVTYLVNSRGELSCTAKPHTFDAEQKLWVEGPRSFRE